MKNSFVLYEAFVNVYEYGGYTQASKALNNNDSDFRSKLQINVKKLETQLDVKLFNGNSEGAVPTSDGERLYKGVKKLLEQFEELESELDPFTGNSPFSIRVTIPAIFSITQFSKFICDFQNEYVKSEIEFFTADCVNALKTKKADFAISLRSELVNKGFDIKDLYEDELVVLHNAELCLPASQELVIDFNFVVSNAMNNIFYQRTGLEINPRLKVDTTEQIYSMVKTGVVDCGLYWKTAIDKNVLETDELRISHIDEIKSMDGKVIISCAYNKSKLTKGERAFLSCLQKHFKQFD